MIRRTKDGTGQMLGSIGAGTHALAGQSARLMEHGAANTATMAATHRPTPLLLPGDRLRITPHPRVVGAVEGVDVLANPRLPASLRDARWAVPIRGDVFGWSPKVSPEHVDQGQLGDCWLLATLGAVAHTEPGRLERMVRDVGSHVIVDFPDGAVAVTKELPTNGRGPILAAGDDRDPVHWPAYVEKALAARHPMGYADLGGGHSADAFREVYGVEPRIVRKPTAGPFRDAVAALRRKEPVTISSYPGSYLDASSRELAKGLKVVGGHAYTPISVETGGSALQLFNPWGQRHPTRALQRDEVDQLFFGSDTPRETRLYTWNRRDTTPS